MSKINAYRDSDLEVPYNFASDTDTTGYHATFRIVDGQGGASLFVLTDDGLDSGSVISFAGNVATVLVTLTDINALPEGETAVQPASLAYDFIVTDDDGIVRKTDGGLLQVWPRGAKVHQGIEASVVSGGGRGGRGPAASGGKKIYYADYKGDDVALMTAVAANPGCEVVFPDQATITRRTTLAFPRGWGGTVNLGTCRIYMTAPVRVMTFDCGFSPLAQLKTDYVKGSQTLVLADSTDMTPYNTQSKSFRIFSNVIDPKNRNKGTGSTQYRLAAWGTIASVSDTTITLLGNLRYATGLWGNSNTIDPNGDPLDVNNRPVVDSFTTLSNARVSTYTNDFEVCLVGGYIEYEDGHQTVWNTGVFTFYGGSPRIEGTKVIRGYGPAFSFVGCTHPRTSHIEINNLPDPLALGGGTTFGYGIAHEGTLGGYHSAPLGRNVRHLFTEAGNNVAANLDGNPSTELLNIWASGVSDGFVVNGGIGIGCQTPWSSHMAGRGRFIDCKSVDSRSFGFDVRGDVTLIRPVVEGGAKGIHVYTDFESGDSFPGSSGHGSEPYNEGLNWAYASCTIRDANVSCVTSGLVLGAALVQLSGKIDIQADTHELVVNSGSILNARGVVGLWKVTGLAQLGADQGLFSMTDTSSVLQVDWTPQINFDEMCDIQIDARLASNSTGNSMYFANLDDADCRFNLNGKITAQGNTHFSKMFQSPGKAVFGPKHTFNYTGFDSAAVANITADWDRWIDFGTVADDTIASYSLGNNANGGDYLAVGTLSVFAAGLSSAIATMPPRATVSIANPPNSFNEMASLDSGSALFAAVSNTNFGSAPGSGTDNLISVSFMDNVIYVNNRSGASCRITAHLRGSSA